MTRAFRDFETKLVHAGEPEPRIHGAVNVPIFQSAMFEYAGEADYHALRYIRLNNTPNHVVLHEKLAALENAEAALVTASGMAAISSTLLTVLSSGDHLLAQDCLYGGTHDLIASDLGRLGIAHDWIDGEEASSWSGGLRPNTKAVYVETVSNPLLKIADLRAVVAFAKRHGLTAIVDNTFATPMNFRPSELGFDLSLHSCTKYLNGHSDIVAGAVIGKSDWIQKVKEKVDHLGGSLDPHAAFLLYRGIKTLSVRMKQQCGTAQKLAEFLDQHAAIRTVHYPGLSAHRGHQRASELLAGYGAMVSFELDGDVCEADRFMDCLRIPVVAPSLGGLETLITRPATTSHLGVSATERKKMGISDALIRLSVGIESAEELIEDFGQALEQVWESRRKSSSA